MAEVYLNIDEILETARELFPSSETADTEDWWLPGDLSVEMLIMAYCSGIFPWYSDDDPILWWSPDPRMIFLPDNINVSKSLRRKLKKMYSQSVSIRHSNVLFIIVRKLKGRDRRAHG